MKNYIYFCSIIIAVLLLSSCNGKTSPERTNDSSLSITTRELLVYEKPPLSKGTNEATTTEYNLGNKEYMSTSNKIMPYEVRGIIGVPEGQGPFPLILISHGSHENEKENLRFDTGFEYLVQHLAENGYIAVSMDMSKPYIWKYGDNDDQEKSIPVANDHIEGLLNANEGNNGGFPIDLKGKIDPNQIALMGHSRGGETVFEIAKDQESRGRSIQAILSIAPTYFFEHNWPDADVAILVPEYDGDVISLDGFITYRSLSKEVNHAYSVTQLMKANHNYFNRKVTRNDASFSLVKNTSVDQLSREQQESFLMDFATDFYHASLKGQKEAFILPSVAQPNTMYDFDVTVMYQTKKAKSIADASEINGYSTEGAEIKQSIDSWFYKNDEVLIDTITSGDGDLMTRELINVKWEQSNAVLKFVPSISDFSEYAGLTINSVIDSADEINSKDSSQSFTILLRDTKGNTSSLTLPPNLNALTYSAGNIDSTSLEDLDIFYWSRSTPLASINLPLSDFKNIDLTNIESVSFVFDQNNKGSIYIDSVWLN